jgi:hypothetical protein
MSSLPTDRVHVRGLLVVTQRDILRELAGAGPFDAAMQLLPRDEREAYLSCGVLSWCPQTTVREATRLIAVELALDPVALAANVVELSVTNALRGPWAILIRLATDAQLIQRAASIFSKAFDRGRLESELAGPGTMILRLYGWPDPQEMDLASIEAAIRAIGILTGKARLEMKRRRKVDHVEWSVAIR